jgi:hypothetical protein
MNIDDLIDQLARDASPRLRFRTLLAAAVAVSVVITAILFFAAIGFRKDIAEAVQSARFLFKFVVTIALAVTAVGTTLRLGRPDGNLGRSGFTLAIAPALLVCAALAELVALPEQQWMPHLVGDNSRMCLTLIPLLAIGPLINLLAALRRGAPANPGLAGAVAGLAASGIAATFYAATCIDDSPLFVITWYPIATIMVTFGGYLIGRRLLTW